MKVAPVVALAILLLGGVGLVEYVGAHQLGDKDGLITSPALSTAIFLAYAAILYLAVTLIFWIGIGSRHRGIGTAAYIAYSVAVTVAGVLVIEIFFRALYFQENGEHPLALVREVSELKTMFATDAALRDIAEIGGKIEGDEGSPRLVPIERWDELHQALYGEAGRDLRLDLEQQYEEELQTLVREVRAMGAKLLVLYIPSIGVRDSVILTSCRDYFRDLARRHGVDYLDLTDACFRYPPDTWQLLPRDRHLSRFGNKIVAQELFDVLKVHAAYRSTVTFDERPQLLGDLPPGSEWTDQTVPSMPYHVISNEQGLRMDYPLTFPKKKQRILILGDSFTYGPYLDNHDSFPYLLDRKLPEAEVVNAGMNGYTISDEISLFMERARYVEPDIVVLQTLDNDLYGLTYFLRNQFDRKHRTFKPSPLEKEFFARIKGQP